MEAEQAAPERVDRRIALAVAPAMVVPLLGSLIYFVAFAGQGWARWTYVLVKIFTLVWPLGATILNPVCFGQQPRNSCVVVLMKTANSPDCITALLPLKSCPP